MHMMINLVAKLSDDNIITFQKTKRKTWSEQGKITLPAPCNKKLDSIYVLKVHDSIEVSILIPNHASTLCYLYHGDNNNTPSYYQFQIPIDVRDYLIKYIADKKNINFEFDLRKREVKIK